MPSSYCSPAIIISHVPWIYLRGISPIPGLPPGQLQVRRRRRRKDDEFGKGTHGIGEGLHESLRLIHLINLPYG